MTCPACREPVFKKVRANQSAEATHFLSHYRADSPEERDCELRVASIMPERFVGASAEGRGQTLDGFMAVLRDAVARNQADSISEEEFRSQVARILSRPAFAGIEPYCRQAVDSIFKMPSPRNIIAQFLASFPKHDGRSPFWLRRQASYVEDVLRHLQSPKAKANFRFVAAGAVANIGNRVARYRSNPDLVPGDMRETYDPLTAVDLCEAISTGKSQAAIDGIIRRITRGHGKAEAERRIHAVHRGLVGELIGPILGLLGSVPYPELAKDRNAVLPSVPSAVEKLMAQIVALDAKEGLAKQAG